ncbi:hypothetical protein ID866_10915 [Astraeus odoratus]|nr:hypothetical protein ID866_10915 [Astraeus odoratus]
MKMMKKRCGHTL